MSGADADGADLRPTLLAVALLGVYGAFFLLEPVRSFFELVPLGWGDWALIGALGLGWAALVMIFWRIGLVDRARTVVQALRSPTIRR